MGASTATCLPSWIALNAARIAISVLPKPTSPQTRRSIGIRALHVALQFLDRRALVGRLDERERVLHLVLPRRVLTEGVALGVDPLLVQHHEFLGDLADGGPDLALGLGEVAAAEAVQRRRLAADVLAERVDLVGRDVELVAALVRDEQVVALDAADRALDHALVLADAVLVVHDVVAGLEVLERGRALALAGAGLAVRPPPTGEVGLGDDGDLGVGQGAATMERGDDDVPTRLGRRRSPPGRSANSRPWSRRICRSRSAEPVPSAATVMAKPSASSWRRRSVEPGAVAADRAPAGRLDERGVG